jgi:hypothetical protein
MKAKTKKWITVVALTLLAVSNISPLAALIPQFVYAPIISGVSLFDAIGYIGLVGTYWVLTRQTD